MLFSIRPATLDDIPAILAIERAAPCAAHWTEGQYKTRIQDGCVLVAAREAQICGFLCARIVVGEWEVENIVVSDEARRHGIGTALMQAMLARCESDAGQAVQLEVRESNAAARALYRKCGLREVGRRRGYYRDPVEDAILYSRSGAEDSPA